MKRTPEQIAALVAGILFLPAAIAGFLPAFTTPPPPGAPHIALGASYGFLLGLFPVNVVHNLVHLAFGAAGLLVSRSVVASVAYLRILAVVLGIFTVIGLIPSLQTVHGVLPLFGHAIWLHGLESVVAGYLGFRPVYDRR